MTTTAENVTFVTLATVGTAVSGTLVGLLIGYVLKSPGKGAAWGAGIGAVVGAIGGAEEVWALNSITVFGPQTKPASAATTGT